MRQKFDTAGFRGPCWPLVETPDVLARKRGASGHVTMITRCNVQVYDVPSARVVKPYSFMNSVNALLPSVPRGVGIACASDIGPSPATIGRLS